MDLTISRPVRIFALVAVLVVAAGGGLLLLERKHTSPPPPPSAAEVRARAHAQAAAARAAAAKAQAQAQAAKAHAARRHAIAKPVAPKVVAAPKAPVLVASDGLPVALAAALRAHQVVVVSLFDPQSQTDAISFAEARAGAADADAGFLGVSVLDNRVAGPLTAVLPAGALLPDPGLLVFRAPDTLVQRIDGFVDRQAVAQAAVTSRTTPLAAAP
jgi:hypothetical protein